MILNVRLPSQSRFQTWTLALCAGLGISASLASLDVARATTPPTYTSVNPTAAYGAYTLFPQGSGRAMGMGGAYTALSDDVSGLLYNPSGLAFNPSRFDAGGTNTRVTNTEADPDKSHLPSNDPYNFLAYGAAVKIKENWAFAAGVSEPFNISQNASSQTGSTSTIGVRILSYDTALARKINDAISVGVAWHYQTLTENLNDTSAGSLEDIKHESYFSGGIEFRQNGAGFGASYRQAQKFSANTSLNNSLTSIGETFFRDVVVPAKTSLGGFTHLGKEFLVAVDVDFIDAVNNALYVSSGVDNLGNAVALDSAPHSVYHGGFEWTLLDTKEATLKWSMGAYHEPNRLVQYGSDRDHITLGLEVRFGPAVLSVSFDQAPNFNNTSQGFSINFGSI